MVFGDPPFQNPPYGQIPVAFAESSGQRQCNNDLWDRTAGLSVIGSTCNGFKCVYFYLPEVKGLWEESWFHHDSSLFIVIRSAYFATCRCPSVRSPALLKCQRCSNHVRSPGVENTPMARLFSKIVQASWAVFILFCVGTRRESTETWDDLGMCENGWTWGKSQYGNNVENEWT